MGRPRSCVCQISANIPPTIETEVDAPTPQKNLATNTVAMFFQKLFSITVSDYTKEMITLARGTGKNEIQNKTAEAIYTGNLPYVSEKGAKTSGAIPKAMVNTTTPKDAVGSDT